MNILKLTLAAALVALQVPAFAHVGDDHGHAPAYDASQVKQTPFGRQGNPERVTRTVELDMTDDMRFTPDRVTVRRGETVKFVVTNEGKVLHELVLGTREELAKHSEMMRQHPGMAHAEPYMAHVNPGASGEVVWQFNRVGEFDFGCLLPGHFEAGMAGKVVVQ
ncbi:MAG: cupredoxin family protein [Burkholderiaceae bacterium]|jgi:uncharacterized cupredoxin-like copper-binding protein|nr:cupredoxin family protein [Burkholderiaceae bacterium]